MTLRATVVIPTFDHGPTLLRAVPTALHQTVREIEVFVVGDGVPELTREIVADLASSDDRIRFFDHPKGSGNGEVHRHAALREASGRIVAYLADDDLWLPDHLEELEGLLRGADFAHSYPIRVEPDGSIGDWNVDLTLPWYREAMLSGTNFVPLSCGGHSLDLYRRLPHGWRTRPEGIPSDLYMWQQILSAPSVRAVSGTRPTVVHLPSSLRPGWSAERRLQELDAWVDRIRRPEISGELSRAVLERSIPGRAVGWQALQDHRMAVDDLTGQLGALADHLREREEELTEEIEELRRDREEERRSLQEQLRQARRAAEARAGELATLRATRTWRLRERLLAAPLVGPLLRWAGGPRSRRAPR